MIDLKELSVEELPLVGPSYAKKLKKLGIETVWDLFHHIPSRFLDFSKNSPISKLEFGETATIHGKITSFVNTYTRSGKTMQIVTIEDSTGKVDAIWFNQIYLSRTFQEGLEVSLAGKLTWVGRKKAIIAPEYEILSSDGLQIHTGHLVPIYPETAGISSKWIRRRMYEAWKKYQNEFIEFLPKEILDKYKLLGFKEAISGIHFPKTMEEFEKAKERLSFNELLNLHIKNLKNKKKWQKNRISSKLEVDTNKIDAFQKTLPFTLTSSQSKVINEILLDLEKDIPMNRLLEGDVGSGKTVVAAHAIFASYLNGKKSLMMAPTQILARQHFNTLKNMFRHTKIRISLATGNLIEESEGSTDLWVGTHSLLNKKFNTKEVSLVVIDEQHKFGVEQRNALVGKNATPHVLTMTATPIPRTVALTFFGDLDLSILDELPKGRIKIVTWVVPETKRESGFNWIHDNILKTKVQAFVVCPLIESSDSETMKDIKNVNTEYEKIKNKFTDLRVGLMHGRLKSKEKEEVVEKFKKGELDILVSTPVVEVGIDIPNATIMVIEAADRFGLASLHQLRGRVGRGQLKSYCLLMTENESEKTQTRLRAMTKHVSGFELAELDLVLRGPGEIYGSKQSGLPELRIADWTDVDMIKNSRSVAESLVN